MFISNSATLFSNWYKRIHSLPLSSIIHQSLLRKRVEDGSQVGLENGDQFFTGGWVNSDSREEVFFGSCRSKEKLKIRNGFSNLPEEQDVSFLDMIPLANSRPSPVTTTHLPS